MVISAKFASVCIRCQSVINPGEKVNWERGVRTVSHVTCPPADRRVAAPPVAPRRYVAKYTKPCGTCGVTIQIGEEIFWTPDAPVTHVECPPAEQVAAVKAAAATENNARADALAKIKKGVYRVSLTGAEKKYGIDYVNLQLVPSEKYNSVKVSQWHGDSIGVVKADGSLRIWNDVERDSVSFLTTIAALDVLLGSADPIEYARAFAIESSTCWRCGLDLVDEFSRATLMGDTCFRAQYGVTQRQGLKSGIVTDARIVKEA